ncbi:MAG TPA: hypothetical protein DD391_07460 [Clostridiales bacterium]|nr:hypothetical protein [Clostridiales bacterium]HBL82417.1 hypothetical protein [Clostridiales bacterium]
MQKKKSYLRVTAILAIMVLCFGHTGVFAEPVSAGNEVSSVARRFSYITEYWNDLTLNSGGRMTCEGETYARTGYLAGVTLELQQYVGYWKTIQTAERSDLEQMYLTRDWYVESGYSYRLKVTHTAYNRSWNVLEDYISYSSEIYY